MEQDELHQGLNKARFAYTKQDFAATGITAHRYKHIKGFYHYLSAIMQFD